MEKTEGRNVEIKTKLFDLLTNGRLHCLKSMIILKEMENSRTFLLEELEQTKHGIRKEQVNSRSRKIRLDIIRKEFDEKEKKNFRNVEQVTI